MFALVFGFAAFHAAIAVSAAWLGHFGILRPGFFILASIVNIGCEIVQQGVCSPEDLDRAVTLGLGYPQGPLAWGNALGPGRVLRVLVNLQERTGDMRYRPSLWLRRRAELGMSLLHA